MEKNISFTQGEEKREQLELPTLHFVTMDQWIDVIGEKALLAWLRMYTWCDRDISKGDKPVDINLWEQSKVPYSLKQMIKKLGVGKDTFYNKIIKPLWNVGLIDIVEYEDSKKLGQKPMNIIIYKYPQNNKSLSFAKISEIRNYDTDYSSTARNFAKKGGRPKKNKDTDSENRQDNVSEKDAPIKDGSISEQGGFSLRTGGGSISEQGGFSLGTGEGSQIGDNNILNNLNNSLNNLNNSLNNNNNSFNSSSSKDIKEEEEEEINRFTIDFLKNELNYSDYTISDIVKHMKLNGLYSLSKTQMVSQARRTILWVSENKKEIREFGYFFINGILKHEPSKSIMDREFEMKKIEKQRKEKKEIDEFIKIYFDCNGQYPTQEEIENRESFQYNRSIPLYNWLES